MQYCLSSSEDMNDGIKGSRDSSSELQTQHRLKRQPSSSANAPKIPPFNDESRNSYALQPEGLLTVKRRKVNTNRTLKIIMKIIHKNKR